MSLEAKKAKEIDANVPHNAPVRIILKDSDVVKAAYRGKVIIGWWQGIKPNPKIGAAILDQLNGMHWIAEVAESHTDEIWDLHLEAIDSITIGNELYI
jgi:hypothetical protein